MRRSVAQSSLLQACFAGGVGLGVGVGSVIGMAAALVPLGVAILYSPWFYPMVIVSLGIVPAFRSYYVLLSVFLCFGLVARLAVGAQRLSPAAGAILSFVIGMAMTAFWTDASAGQALVALAPSGVLLLGCVRWRISQRRALLCLVSAGLIHAVLVISQFATSGGQRVTGLGPYALPTMVVGGVAAIGLVLIAEGRRRPLIASAFVMFCGIAATETRGMVAGYVIGSLAVPALLSLRWQHAVSSARMRKRRSRYALYLAVGIVATVTAVKVVLRGRTGRFAGESVAAGGRGRLDELGAALDELGRAPFLGHGAGHIFLNPITGSSGAQDVNYVHNSLLYFGIVGGSMLMVLYVWMLVRIVRTASVSDPNGMGRVVAGCLIGLFVYSLTAAIQRTLHFNMFIAMLAAITPSVAERHQRAQQVAPLQPAETS